MTPLAAVAWSLTFFLCRIVAAVLTEQAHPGALGDIVNEAAFVVLAASLTAFFILRVHAPESSVRETIGWRLVGPGEALLAIAVGVGLWPGLSTLTARILARWPYPEKVIETLSQMPTTLPARVALVVVALVVIPVALELVFRGMIFGELAKGYPAGVAAAVSSLCFAATQVDPRQLPLALILSTATARLRQSTGSVIAPILAVLAFGSVEAVQTLRGVDEDITYSPRIIVGGAAVAVLVLVALGRRRRAR